MQSAVPSVASSLSDNAFESSQVVTVVANRHQENKLLNSQLVSDSDTIDTITSVTDLLQTLPGVTLNGQPGLFQTVNIRGIARQRVLLFVDGVRITSERRAGVAASFIDPNLIQFAEVTQGAASTYYGSGAIGGSVHLTTKSEYNHWVDSSLSSAGGEFALAAGSGFGDTSFGVAYRNKNKAKTPQEDIKNNQFTQLNVLLNSQIKLQDYNFSWRALYAKADDIGKDNLRYSALREIKYPDEEHLIVKFDLDQSTDWRAQGYLHDQSLITQDTRVQERINTSKNQSTDLGFSLDNRWSYSSFEGQYGVDLFSRQKVEATETELDLPSLTETSTNSLSGASDTELATFITLNTELAWVNWMSGVRANYQVQKSDLSDRLADKFTTYFMGIERNIANFGFSLGYSTGFRFASLSERLYSGITARGNVLGNPNLKPEKSRSIDFGVQYQIQQVDIELTAFQTKVDNLIERVSVNSDTKTYVNSAVGKINGWQYQAKLWLSEQFKLQLSGQKIWGKNQAEQRLTDIPAQQHSLKLNFSSGAVDIKTSFTRRLATNGFGDGELARESANILSTSLTYYVNPQWQWRVSINNLLNERYFASLDDLSTMAEQRSIGLKIKYRQ
ncbi:TonB-dependent receptor [Aliikangiella sp. IMCC44653]